MKITYYALKPIRLGLDYTRSPGELVPEASEWKNLDIKIRNLELMPVLVCTLPKEMQAQLENWEEAVVDAELATIDEIERQASGEPLPRPKQNDAVSQWRSWASQFYDDADEMTKAEIMKLPHGHITKEVGQ